MKVLSLIACAHAAPSVAAPNDGCYWQSSKSGGYVECLPDYYIRAACESVSFFLRFINQEVSILRDHVTTVT